MPHPVADDPRRGRVEHRPDRRADAVVEAGEVGLHEVVAELRAERHRVVERPDAVGVPGLAAGQPGGVGDAQPTGVGADLRGERPGRGRRGVRVAGRRARRWRRAAPRCRAPRRVTACSTAQPPTASPYSGPSGLRARVGFSPNSPHAAAGIAQRTTEVVAVGHRHHPRRDGSCRSAARSAGRALRVPRVAGGPVQARLAGGHHAELGCVGAAQDHQARTAQPVHQLRGEGGDVAAQELRALVERRALDLHHEVLEQVGHAPERTRRSGGRDGRAGLVVQRRHHSAQDRVEPLDPLDRPLDELGGRDLAVAHEGGLVGRVEQRDIRGRAGHRPPP